MVEVSRMDLMPHQDEHSAKVIRILRDVLNRQLKDRSLSMQAVEEDTSLTEHGIIDSQALLDIIFTVEELSGLSFDPERLDFEQSLNLRQIAAAFVTGS